MLKFPGIIKETEIVTAIFLTLQVRDISFHQASQIILGTFSCAARNFSFVLFCVNCKPTSRLGYNLNPRNSLHFRDITSMFIEFQMIEYRYVRK